MWRAKVSEELRLYEDIISGSVQVDRNLDVMVCQKRKPQFFYLGNFVGARVIVAAIFLNSFVVEQEREPGSWN